MFKLPLQRKVRQMAFVMLLLLFCQSVLGTAVRMYVDDVSKALEYAQRSTWLEKTPWVFLIHRSFSWLVLLGAIYMAWYCRNIRAIKNKTFTLAGIAIISMATGIILFYMDMPAAAQPLHLLFAALAITQAVAILLQTKTA